MMLLKNRFSTLIFAQIFSWKTTPVNSVIERLASNFVMIRKKKFTTVATLNCPLLLAQLSPIQTPSSETFAEFDGQPISHHSLWEKLQRMIPVRNVTWLNQNKLNLSKFPQDVISKSHHKNENGKTISLISSFMSRTRILYHSDRFLHPYISLNPFLL